MAKVIAFPFEIDTKTHVSKQCDELGAIKNSVQLILNTQLGERTMMPEFGTRLKEYLFESMREETFALMEREIIASLQRWEPRIYNLNITFLPEESTLYIIVAYETKYHHQEEVKLAFQR